MTGGIPLTINTISIILSLKPFWTWSHIISSTTDITLCNWPINA